MIILASASERRKNILSSLGINFECIPADIDESEYACLPPDMLTEMLSLKKALCISSSRPDDFIIAADTVVFLDGKIYGKPKNEEEAKDFLKELSGRFHEVYTGYTLIFKGKIHTSHRKTRVKFANLTPSQIDSYVATREPLDKAGAYGIQGLGAVFVEKIDGDYQNVVGLPISAVFADSKNYFNIDFLNM